MEWANDSINESKRVLTVRPNGGRFKYIEDAARRAGTGEPLDTDGFSNPEFGDPLTELE